MITYKLKLDRDSNFSEELSRFFTMLQSSNINQDDSKFLMEQVENAVLQYQRHLSIDNAKSFSMNRLFEGTGYKVTISLGKSSKGILDKVLDLFRG